MPYRLSILLPALALLSALAGCTPPRHAAVTSCTIARQLGEANPLRECTMQVAEFDGNASAAFTAESPRFYRHYEADAEFHIEHGSVLVRVLGGHEPVEFVVEPGRPWKGRIVGRLNRSEQRFHVSLMPQGSAGGLQATIRHRNVVRSLVSPTEVLPQG